MADFALEQCETNEIIRDDYRQGELSTQEAYDNGLIDELGHEIDSVTFVICRCCHKSRLTWGNYNGKWTLFDGDEIHDCPANKLKR